MPRASEFKPGFLAGEISPLLEARQDSRTYAYGASKLENLIVMPQGGVQNRAGFEFIAETKDHTKSARMVSFVFSTVQAYTLEFGHQYIRFYRDGGQIVEADKTVVSITKANPGVAEITGHGFSDGDQGYFSSMGGMTELEGVLVTVANKTTDTFELTDVNGDNIDTSAYGTFTAGTFNRIYTVATSYTESDLDALQFTQSADVMYIVHPSYKPQKLTRTGHTSWTLSNYAPTADPFTSSNNYPSCVTIYEQRLVFAATNNAPQKIWATVAGDYEDMTVGTSATAAFTYTIGSNQVNAIKFLFSADFLLIGTFGGVFVARGSGQDEAITPTNIQIKRHISHGAKNDLPVLVESVCMFIERLSRKIMASALNQYGTYISRKATLQSDHITGDGVKQLAYQAEPYGVLWMVRDDGQVVGATVEIGEDVNAWHRHVTDGVVESLCVTPAATGDELWLLVKRTINGNTVRYIEKLHERLDATTEEGFFVDSGLTYDGSAATVIGGLGHLEGEEVAILADGAVAPNDTVSGGEITLPSSATKVHVGLPYDSTGVTTRLMGGSADGTAQGKNKRIHRAVMRFYNTVGCLVGADPDDETKVDRILFNAGQQYGNPPAPFTGDKEVLPPGGWNKKGQLVFKQNQPLPMTVLGVMAQYTVNDG